MTGMVRRSAWLTAAELAELALPEMPATKRGMQKKATVDGWAERMLPDGTPLARPREGRGGGLEYHVALLPLPAAMELLRRGLIPADSLAGDLPDPAAGAPEEPAPAKPITEQAQAEQAQADPEDLWAWYDAAPERVRREAERRLAVIEAIEALEADAWNRSAAVQIVSASHKVAPRTCWRWLEMIDGCAAQNRLPLLAPRPTGPAAAGTDAEIDHDLWQLFKSDYLRPERPSLSSCWRRAQAVAKARGITIPHQKTFRRRLERDVPAAVITARRQGAEAHRRLLPPQQRSVADLQAMELVNIDGHRWDVFVRWPDGRVARPTMVAIQDVYSRKMLAWRVGETESAILTRLAFADLFRQWGIPQAVLLDNGRAFASKWITGGAATRFRFKVRADEPLGLLTALGIKNHWATPYRGQSKPIERGFRDFCDAIARHPAFAGAWTGNRVDAKPENYAAKAIDLETFLRIVEMGVREHNAREGRRTETAGGRSFDQAFAESYERAAIGRATPEQLRLALLAADRVRADRQTGAIRFMGNSYWCEALGAVAGQLLTIRFDPDNLHGEIHAYDAVGRFITTVPLWEATGFIDAAAARRRAKLEADHRRRTRELIDLEQLLTAETVAALLPADRTDGEDGPETTTAAPKVIRPVRLRRGQAAAVAKPEVECADAPEPAFIDRFAGAVARLRIVD